MNTRRAVFLVPLATAVVLSGIVGTFALGAGVVTAGHGATEADFTVEPMSDRSPGASDVKYGQIVVGQAGIDYRTLESMKAVYEEGSWANCGPSKSEVFGIDRGNTHDGYEIDEDLTDNTKTFSAGEDVFEVEFYGEDDFGSTVHLNDGDAVVSVASCIDNPDEPGWYQISGSTTGVTENGDRTTISGESHYFWICDCEDESEAREELGPPPSEPEPTETPDDPATGSDDGSDGGDDGTQDGDSGGENSGGDTSTADGSTDEQPADEGSTDAGASTSGDDGRVTESESPEESGSMEDASSDSGPQSAASADEASWQEHKVQTPTPGNGDGFGGLVALAALLGAAMLFYRRN